MDKTGRGLVLVSGRIVFLVRVLCNKPAICGNPRDTIASGIICKDIANVMEAGQGIERNVLQTNLDGFTLTIYTLNVLCLLYGVTLSRNSVCDDSSLCVSMRNRSITDSSLRSKYWDSPCFKSVDGDNRDS